MSARLIRLAACEACRRSKLACSRERPSCARCNDWGQSNLCVYRTHPFQRRRIRRSRNEQREPIPSSIEDAASPITVPTSSAQHLQYPNPGYLGLSSHSTLFDQFFRGTEPDVADFPSLSQNQMRASLGGSPDGNAMPDRSMNALMRLDRMNVSKIARLVHSWLNKDSNLPLAWPFVAQCLDSVEQWRELLIPEHVGFQNASTLCAETLLGNTQKPILMSQCMSTQDLLNQMLGENIRWESLGIFFTAAARAAYDTPYFTSLYTTNDQRRRLIKALTYMGDCCLEICLSLDCLNDLQLVLQYENFIIHSQLDGDQSYHSWRRFGDVLSSLFAMGYHEKIGENASDIPTFVIELRKACFARIYAADKSLAVFLGRPPRMVKAYCQFQIPDNTENVWADSRRYNRSDSTALSTLQSRPEPISYTADTRCSAQFAYLKEEVLQLLRKKHVLNDTTDLGELHSRVDQQWEDLPANFKLGTSLKQCQRRPFERDFLAGIRLDYLHIHFLLGLVYQQRTAEPNDRLLTIATEMLSISVELIILRDQLVNSGSCLIWKVAQYGLPAAGIVSLALLNSTTIDVMLHSKSKMIQSLGVLVAEITTGAWIQAGDPNFAFFIRSAGTIQILLDSLLVLSPTGAMENDLSEGWNPYTNSQLWEFDAEFWTNLSVHPTLLR